MRSWLLEIRKKKRLTQEQVALKSGIKRSYYSMIEGGKRNPSVDVGMRIGKTLDFDWSLFFTQKGNETTR